MVVSSHIRPTIKNSSCNLSDASTVVSSHIRPTIKNRILAGLSLSDFDYIRPFLEPVVLTDRSVLHEPNKPIDHVNFIETGIVSLRTLAIGSILETAMVGCYGAVGASVALGEGTSLHRSIVLVPGNALRIRTDDLQRSTHERPQIREHLLRYVQSLMTHSSQIALCGVRHELEQRLACWLCLACDALDGNVLPVTHDHLSTILGLRRAGVTETLSRFEEEGLVRKTRGVLQVRDRRLLRQKACGCYTVIANEYERTNTSMHAA
jgi:CRP-like cAMP-binding protein